MPAIYLCDVIGTGTGRDPYRPSIDTDEEVCLMIDTDPQRQRNKFKSVVWSQYQNLTGVGVTLIAQAATKDALITLLQTTNITNGQRNQINSWLTGGDYTNLPVGQQTQYNAIMFVCQQVNPAVDMSVLVK